MTMLRTGGLLDVLTPLSDCRQESVEKMERRVSGVSYMCWMDFHNEILSCGSLCARLISFSIFLFCLLSCLFSGYHAEGYHALSILHGLSRPELSRLYHHCTAITPVHIYPGYHAKVLSSIPGLSHLSYHAPPHTYIGSSHPPLIVVCSLPFTGYYATCSSPPTPPPGRHTYEPTPHGHWTKQQ